MYLLALCAVAIVPLCWAVVDNTLGFAIDVLFVDLKLKSGQGLDFSKNINGIGLVGDSPCFSHCC